MNKFIRLLIFYLIIPSYVSCFYELNELSIVLNKLANLKAAPSETFEEPTEEFYSKLDTAMDKVISAKDQTLLDQLGSSESVKIAKFIASILGKARSRKYGIFSNELVAIVKIFNKIKANYDKSQELSIVSLASGRMELEYLLLRTLIENGYSKIKFYAIDPSEVTEEKINEFKQDINFQDISIFWFSNLDTFIKKIMREKRERPDVCVTFSPLYEVKGDTNFVVLGWKGTAPEARYAIKNTLLFIPQYFDELSLLSIDLGVISKLNASIASCGFLDEKTIVNIFMKTDFSSHMSTKFGSKSIKGEYHNLIVDFLQLIKLASSSTKDCIAYFIGTHNTVEFNDIRKKLIAELYLPFSHWNKDIASIYLSQPPMKNTFLPI